MRWLILDGSGNRVGDFLTRQDLSQTAYSGCSQIEVADDDPRLTPVPTAAQVQEQKLAAGLAITSTGTPSLSATYGLDQTSQDQLWNIALGVASGLGLPGNASSFEYPDITGTPHSFNATQITNLAKAVRDYVFALNVQTAIAQAGGTPSYPAATATIA